MIKTLTLPAPAKLNLFLHITGRRPDGYHELETVFQFLEIADTLHFSIRDDSELHLTPEIPEVSEEENLITKAARALKSAANQPYLGVDIRLEKKLPMGGGLGGGSSDAATTLIALNKLWALNFSMQELAAIGIKLGADVPIFIHGFSSFAKGVGEQLQEATPTESYYLIIHPQQHVSTGAIFTHPNLTRNTKPLGNIQVRPNSLLTGMNWQNLNNDCQDLVFNLYPTVAAAHNWLLQYAASKMTGTGACLFAPFSTEEAAQQVLEKLPKQYRGWIAKGMNRSPAHLALASQLEG